MGLFVDGDRVLTPTGLNRDGGNFLAVQPLIDRTLGASQTLDGEGIHLFPGQPVLVGCFLRKGAHCCPGVGILQSIQKHMVIHLAVPQALSATTRHQNLWRIGHALQSPADHELIGPGSDAVSCKNRRLHATTTGLVDGDRPCCIRDTGAEHGLSSRALLQACWQDTAHEHLVNRFGAGTRALQSRANGRGTQLVGCRIGKITQQPAHGGPGAIDNHHIGHGLRSQIRSGRAFSPNCERPASSRGAVYRFEGFLPDCSSVCCGGQARVLLERAREV